MAKFTAPYELVIIEWEDIKTEYSWQAPSILWEAKPAKCVSTGFLLEKDKHQLVICSGYADDHDLLDVTSFPIGAVRKIIYVSGVTSTAKHKHKT